MRNPPNIFPSQRWERSMLCCYERRCSCQGPVLLFESQGERGEMRKRALMMVLGKFDKREICIASLTASHSLVVAALCLNLRPSCKFAHFSFFFFFFFYILQLSRTLMYVKVCVLSMFKQQLNTQLMSSTF